MPDYTLPERGKVALLTINAQRDFIQAGSPLRTSGVTGALRGVSRLVKGFREHGLPIVHAVRLYRPDGSNVDICRRQAVQEGLRVLMPGTSGAELIDELKPHPAARLSHEDLLAGEFQQLGEREWAMYRPRWGAFYGTTLEEHLRALGATTIVICGFNFTTSGRATIYDAGARDFRVVLASDAISNANEEGLKELGRIGVYLMNVDACLSWVSAPTPSEKAA
jgi:nicotinamidase-related amidase